MISTKLTLAFIHAGKAFLPELDGYKRFFSGLGLQVLVLHPNEANHQHIDIEWHMMGTDFRRGHKNTILIHEYASPSTPPMAKVKDQLKKWLNCRPDYRLFLNEATAREMAFTDRVPFGYRDMFINSRPIAPSYLTPAYDFIYAGSLEAARDPEKLLDVFATGTMKTSRLLVLSQNYSALQKRYGRNSNIEFKGPVPPSEVGHYICQARFGIDYRPLKKPYDIQTSAKLLEYVAQGIPVISSGTNWVKDFMEQYGGRFFLIKPDMSNFTMEALVNFPFAFPDLREWNLQHQLNRSGVLDFLANKTGLKIFSSYAADL